jgi:hypothetical protein
MKPGTMFDWPEDLPPNDVPSLKLRPIDEAAYALLLKVHGEKKVKDQWGEFEPWTPEKPRVEVPQSPAQMARAIEAGESPVKRDKKSKRLADQ